MKSALLRGLPLLVLLIGAVWAGSSVPVGDDGRLSGAEVYRRTLRGVAWVLAPDAGKGTGWVLDRSHRLLVTCAHVVGDNKTVDVVFPCVRDGAVVADRGYYYEHMEDVRVRGRVLKRNPGVDLALLQLDSLPDAAAALPLADDAARPGDRVNVIGCRYDIDALWAYSTGEVRQVQTLKDGYFSGGQQLAKGARVISAQVPINEGDSGGPLVNERGEVVAVAAALAWEAHGAGLFIDVAEVRALADLKPPENPQIPSDASFVGRGVYREGVRSLALVRTEGDRRWSAWLLDRSRRLLLTTAEAVGKREAVDVIFPAFRDDGRVVADAASYRDEPRLLREKGLVTLGTVLAADLRRNLALLELGSVPATAAEVKLADEPPSPGDSLHALGNPGHIDVLWVYTAATVRQLGRINLGQTMEGPDPDVLIVQAPLAEGEGGGPLFNHRAELVGVVSGKTGPQQQVAFCLTAAEVRGFLDENRLRWEPASANGLVQRGMVFTKARQYARAIADFDAALRLDGRYAPALGERGRAEYLQEDDDGAVRDCGAAIEADPKLAAAYCWRAAALCRKGDASRAVADCTAALAIDGQNALARAVRGDAYRRLGDLDKALADCDEAVWLDRQLAAAYLYRGEVYAQKREPDKAIAEFTKALQFDDHLSEAHCGRADAEWFKSDVAAALADYDQALAIRPRDAAALHGRGRALAAKGEHAAALAALDAALKIDPHRASVYVDRGAERLHGGDRDGGLADFTEAARLEPARTADVLTALEREADRAPPAEWCDLCRRVLTALRPLLKDNLDVQKAIDSGLAAAAAERNVEQRAGKLRATIAELRGKLQATQTPRSGWLCKIPAEATQP
jgi:tetratricopeptide (TPR) repeat protein